MTKWLVSIALAFLLLVFCMGFCVGLNWIGQHYPAAVLIAAVPIIGTLLVLAAWDIHNHL